MNENAAATAIWENRRCEQVLDALVLVLEQGVLPPDVVLEHAHEWFGDLLAQIEQGSRPRSERVEVLQRLGEVS